MPRTVQHIRVFVASPADVGEERSRVEKVVRELNLAASVVQFELIRWETHTHPDFGPYPQDVVGSQIGTDYDVFVGILWSRIGTATPRAPSGTLEEFHAAYEKWKNDPKSIILMVYFKEEPISPTLLDPDQLRQVHDFRKALPSTGSYYWSFKTVDDFETQLRLHLARCLQEWTTRLRNLSVAPAPENSQSEEKGSIAELIEATNTDGDEDESELGFLDYMQLVADANERLLKVLGRMTSATELIGRQMDDRSREIEAISKNFDLGNARAVVEQSAHDLNDFSAAIIGEIPKLSQSHEDFLKYLAAGAALSSDFGTTGKRQVQQILNELDTFTGAIDGAKTVTDVFRGVLEQTPRMTVLLNRARRRATGVLEDLIKIFAELIAKNLRIRDDITALVER